jgi:hypothetical protein
MKEEMTRIVILSLALFLFTPVLSFATADSPEAQGLGGAGRAALSSEGMFLNPASLALLTQSEAFLYYEKPRIPDWNAGGRYYSVGVYDGTNAGAKGAFGFLRTSRARVGADGTQTYEDRSEFRFASGYQISPSISAGLSGRYVTRRTGANEEKFWDGDLGVLFPLYAGMTGAVTYENVLNKNGDNPPTLGAGLAYLLGSGLTAFADGYRVAKGMEKGDKGWSLGAEITLAADFQLRLGKFQDGYRRNKGWSFGLGWQGPRTSFEYAMRLADTNPGEKDQIFAINVAF